MTLRHKENDMTDYRRNVTLMLRNKRIAFTDLAKPRSINGGKPTYGTRVIIQPTDADVAALDAAMKEVACAQWKDSGPAALEMLIENNRVAFSKKPYRNSKGEIYKGFEGNYSLGCSAPEDKRPGYFDEFGQELLDEAAVGRKLYPGCYAHVKVEIYPLVRSDGNRINCALLGVMYAGPGEAFGGGSGPATASDFAGLAQQPKDPLADGAGDYV